MQKPAQRGLFCGRTFPATFYRRAGTLTGRSTESRGARKSAFPAALYRNCNQPARKRKDRLICVRAIDTQSSMKLAKRFPS